jgi:hypothetical protein
MEVEPATDRISMKFVADGTQWMGSEYSTAADSVFFSIEVSAETNIASLQLYRNGTFLKSIGVGTASTTWNTFDTPGPGDFYYLVRLNQSDGDRAWSSPIWIESTSSFSLPVEVVKQNDANGFPALWFQTVTVQGLVTAGTGELHPTDNKVFLQDPTGGTMMQEFGAQSVFLNRGDNVIVTGTVDTFLGQTFISAPSNIDVQSTGGAPPDPAVRTTAQVVAEAEELEGSLVEVRAVSIVGGTWPAPGFSGEVILDDGSGPLTMVIDRNTDLDETGPPADSVFTARGLITQQDSSPPYDCCHVLLPRDSEDLFELQGVGVAELPSHHAATRTSLEPARPNPFGDRTAIRFELGGPRDQPVVLSVHDVTGRRIRTLVDERMSPGSFELEWDGRDSGGVRVAAGVYFTRLVTPDVEVSRKIVRLN